jgi:hypothetical protein
MGGHPARPEEGALTRPPAEGKPGSLFQKEEVGDRLQNYYFGRRLFYAGGGGYTGERAVV